MTRFSAPTGSTPFDGASPPCSRTGTCCLPPHAGLWEPSDGRPSRTVLRGREGEASPATRQDCVIAAGESAVRCCRRDSRSARWCGYLPMAVLKRVGVGELLVARHQAVGDGPDVYEAGVAPGRSRPGRRAGRVPPPGRRPAGRISSGSGSEPLDVGEDRAEHVARRWRRGRGRRRRTASPRTRPTRCRASWRRTPRRRRLRPKLSYTARTILTFCLAHQRPPRPGPAMLGRAWRAR